MRDWDFPMVIGLIVGGHYLIVGPQMHWLPPFGQIVIQVGQSRVRIPILETFYIYEVIVVEVYSNSLALRNGSFSKV